MEFFSFRGYDLPLELVHLTGGGPDSFESISDWHQKLLKEWIQLKPSDHVVEIGCGIGRDAIPLTKYITTGTYLGIDIIRPSIAWCTSNISEKNQNFKFVHFDVFDQLHNNVGTTKTSEIVIPAEPASVDKIFLYSVFTHMLRSDIEHYLREFCRVLKPDGMIYATTFLYNDEILAAARRTNITPFDLRFEHEIENGCRINDPQAPLGAVAYTTEVWDQMVKACGLEYSGPFLTGAWSGFYEHPQEGQDVALLRLAQKEKGWRHWFKRKQAR